MNILLIEDDIILSNLMCDFLSEYYEITCAYDGEEAYDILNNKKFSLIITDINMPNMNGLEFVKSIREYCDTTPVIMITAYQDLDTLKKGFALGVNDYLKKPFELEELNLRIKNIAKQYSLNKPELINLGNGIEFDMENKKIITEDNIYILKPKEYELLHYLVTHNNHIVSSMELIQNLWMYDNMPSDATIRTYIKTIRKYIGKDNIETIHGVGYKFVFN